MPELRPLKGTARAVVEYLRAEAEAGRGWIYEGVRGWRLVGEVKETTGYFTSDVLQDLGRWGWLEARDIRRPGSAQPLYLYRIGPRFRESDDDRARFPGPDETLRPPILITRALRWEVLRTLRRAVSDAHAPLRFGVRGWLTSREVQKRMERRIFTDDLHMWEACGALVVRSAPAVDGGRRMAAFYRATGVAWSVKLLLDPDPGGDPRRLVQLVWTPPPAHDAPSADAAHPAGRPDDGAPLLDEAREVVRARVAHASLRIVARQIGTTPTTVRNFIGGRPIYGRTREAVLRWLVKEQAEEGGPVDAERAARMLELLLHPLDAPAGSRVRADALTLFAAVFARHEAPAPLWLTHLRTTEPAGERADGSRGDA